MEGYASMPAGAMVLLGDAGLGRDYCLTIYSIPLDDRFLCRRVSPGGLVLVGGLVCSADGCVLGHPGGVFCVWPLATPEGFLLP